MAMIIAVLVGVLICSAVLLFLYSRRINLRWRPAYYLRLIMIVVILAGIYFSSVDGQEFGGDEFEILVLDGSDSIDQTALVEMAEGLMDWQDARDNRGVIVFGETVEYLLSDEWPTLVSRASNLSKALESARGFLQGQSGRVIVATDGIVEHPDEVERELKLLADQMIRVDFIEFPGVMFVEDLYLGEIVSPEETWEKSNFIINVPVYAPREGKTNLRVTINGGTQTEIPIEVEAGWNSYRLPINSGNAGILLVGATVKWEGDPFLENNTIYAGIEVLPPPRILLVSPDTSEAGILFNALEDEGVEIKIVSPDELTTVISELAQYQAILLYNLLAREISYEQMLGLKTFVVDLGRSLIFLGGRNSFNLGGYENTILEPLLPIDLTPPGRIQRVPATYVMVLDRSGSMEEDEASDISPIAMTKEAAIRAIESLRPDDYLGVLTFSSKTEWVVGISEVGEGMNLRLAQDAVSQIQTGGGTLISQALEEALAQLIKENPTNYKHILILTDGASDDEDDTFEKFSVLAEIARRQNITISTIALGYESDSQTLSFIAQQGNGRYYEVLDPTDLPGVMVAESKAAHSENIQLGVTNLVDKSGEHPMLSGFNPEEIPLAEGYIAVTSKQDLGSEDILVSGNFGDPILSTWQVGLGHVTTWMGDMGLEWVPGMDTWNREGDFWKQVILYTLPDPSFDLSNVEFMYDSKNMLVQLEVFDYDGTPVNNLKPEFVYADFNEKPILFQMDQTGVGEYQVVIPRPKADGYRGAVLYNLDEVEWEVAVPFAVNYPREWQFDYTGMGQEIIEQWITLTGGQRSTFEQELFPDVESTWFMEIDQFKVLLGISIIYWLFEIAIRRWKMPWRRP